MPNGEKITTNLGRVSLVPKGTYDEAATYERLDLVQYEDNGYVARHGNLTGVTPVDGTDWMLLVGSGSAALAKQYTDAAQQAKTAAETAQGLAEAAKNEAELSKTSAADSAQTATEKATEAEDAAGRALVSEQSAADSKAAAEEAKTAAEKSKDAAATSETNAENWKKWAESYAHGKTQVREEEDTDNGLYYLEQTRTFANSLTSALRPMGDIDFAGLKALASPTAGDFYNVTDEFTSDETFVDGGDVVYPAGTDVYRTAEDKWNATQGAGVAGVKGKSEAVYRKGLVEVTPENIGAVSTEGGTVTGDLTVEGTLTANEATAEKAGLMSAADKKKSDASIPVVTFAELGVTATMTLQELYTAVYARQETSFYAENWLNNNETKQLWTDICAKVAKDTAYDTAKGPYGFLHIHKEAATIYLDLREYNTGNIFRWTNSQTNSVGESDMVLISDKTPFTSADVANDSATAWTDVAPLAPTEKHTSIFTKISTMFKNIRFLYKMLGTTDISSIGGGTLTGAISALNTKTDDIVKVVKVDNPESLTIPAHSIQKVAINIPQQNGYKAVCVTEVVTNGAVFPGYGFLNSNSSVLCFYSNITDSQATAAEGASAYVLFVKG